MATQTLKLNVKSGEKDGKKFWDRYGVPFINTDDSGNITSINVKKMFFDVENFRMIAASATFFSFSALMS